ncbi:hypothetical protein ACFTWH_08435 [Streptomyces sp. NPDC057011]|uniref:hypothetical protein n=1 Tax=unclassified Streptomyces TaxID=2593676 RepID=UPI0036388733
MFPAPAPEIRDRMHAAYAQACEGLHLAAPPDPRVWGYQGRTLSGPSGDCWLRLVSEPDEKAGGKLWDGPLLARRALPAAVRRPALLRVHDWSADGWSYRAELYDRLTAPVVSVCPVLDEDPALPETWWADIRGALGTLAAVPTERVAVREEYIRRVVPQYTGHQVEDITWSTAHDDLHWANVTTDGHVIDWEGWGTGPYGFDAATLHIYALRAPDTAARVRKEFAPILDRPEARVAVLTVCAQILQAEDRTDYYRDLAGHVREHLKGM